MKKETAELILYQLVEARRVLQYIMQDKTTDPKEAAAAYFFRFTGGAGEREIDEFFATEDGKKIAAQFGLERSK